MVMDWTWLIYLALLSVDNLPDFLEQVVDSSRYFAIRIQGDAGKEAMIGFGFR